MMINEYTLSFSTNLLLNSDWLTVIKLCRIEMCECGFVHVTCGLDYLMEDLTTTYS